MNVNVHGSGSIFWNLGLARITGSLKAERCIGILKEKLKDNWICLDLDVVCTGTGGASVMAKVGKIIDAEQQLCFAHGLQLAVIDVLYNKELQETQSVKELSSESDYNELSQNDSDCDELDDWESAENDNMVISNIHLKTEPLPNIDLLSAHQKSTYFLQAIQAMPLKKWSSAKVH